MAVTKRNSGRQPGDDVLVVNETISAIEIGVEVGSESGIAAARTAAGVQAVDRLGALNHLGDGESGQGAAETVTGKPEGPRWTGAIIGPARR